MTAYEVQKERWVFKLAPHLTGKVHQAYTAMAAENACEYEHLKAAILKRDSTVYLEIFARRNFREFRE